MYKNFFITGYPGSGKTTIFNDIVTNLKKTSPNYLYMDLSPERSKKRNPCWLKDHLNMKLLQVKIF